MEKDDKIILAKIEDALRRCDRENRIICTDFLDMRLQGMAESELRRSGARYLFYGGYEGCERRILVFLPDYADESFFLPGGVSEASEENFSVCDAAEADDFSENPLEILRVTHKAGGRELSHRDYLGSLLGLGITRDKIGDIIVCPEGADIIIQKDMEEFLLSNYFKAGRTELCLSVHPLTELNLSAVRTEEITDTVASLRLDAFLAAAYRSARSKAADAVRQGLVFVNNAQCLKPDLELKQGDIVVLRGKGKCVLEKIGGTSRKERVFITIKKYI